MVARSRKAVIAVVALGTLTLGLTAATASKKNTAVQRVRENRALIACYLTPRATRARYRPDDPKPPVPRRESFNSPSSHSTRS